MQPERAAVGDQARQRVDELAEVDALERGGEPGVAVEQDHDPRQRLGVRALRGTRRARRRRRARQLLPALERLAEVREEPLDALLVLAEDDAPQCGSASSAISPRVAKSRP